MRLAVVFIVCTLIIGSSSVTQTFAFRNNFDCDLIRNSISAGDSAIVNLEGNISLTSRCTLTSLYSLHFVSNSTCEFNSEGGFDISNMYQVFINRISFKNVNNFFTIDAEKVTMQDCSITASSGDFLIIKSRVVSFTSVDFSSNPRGSLINITNIGPISGSIVQIIDSIFANNSVDQIMSVYGMERINIINCNFSINAPNKGVILSAEETFIQGLTFDNNTFNSIAIHQQGDLSILNSNFSNNRISPSAPYSLVHVVDGDLYVTTSAFSFNQLDYGAIGIGDTIPVQFALIIDSEFKYNNLLESPAALIRSLCLNTTISNCRFTDNLGSAIYSRLPNGNISIILSEFKSNTPTKDGIIVIDRGFVSMKQSSITESKATAIYIKDGNLESYLLTISNCTIPVNCEGSENSVLRFQYPNIYNNDFPTICGRCSISSVPENLDICKNCTNIDCSSCIASVDCECDISDTCISPKGSTRTTIYIIIGAVSGGIIIIIVIVAFVFGTRKTRKSRKLTEEIELRKSSSHYLSKAEIRYNDLTFKNKLGAGAFGVVYLGEYRMALVAIKKLKVGTIDLKSLADFRKEMDLMIAIKPHPNIISVLGICSESDDRLCIVTSYCEKGSLYSYIRNHELSQKDVIKLLRGVAAGMYHLAREGIVHRDLAARNVLLDKDLTPKVSDFGFSRFSNNSENSNSTATVVGPLKWMAPECLSSKQYSEKSDIWSFGILCWEVVNRSDPYPTLDNYMASVKVLTEKLTPTLPDEKEYQNLAGIMKSCYEFEAEKRPTFKAICDQLGEVKDIVIEAQHEPTVTHYNNSYDIVVN